MWAISSFLVHSDAGEDVFKFFVSNKVRVIYHILGMQNGIRERIIFKCHPGTCKKAVLNVHLFQKLAANFMAEL